MRGDPRRRGRALLVVGVVLLVVGLGAWVVLSGDDREPNTGVTPSTVVTTSPTPTVGGPSDSATPPTPPSSPAPVTVTVPAVAGSAGGTSVLGQITALLGALTGLILAVTGLIQLLRAAKKT